MRDPSKKPRREAMHRFAVGGRKEPGALGHLATLLTESDELAVAAAEQLCATAGQAGADHVTRALDHSSVRVRLELVRWLGKVRDLKASSAEAARTAAALARRLGTDSDPGVRELAVQSLSRHGDRAVDPLIGALRDSATGVRNIAAHHLGQMGVAAARALPALRAHHKATTNKVHRAIAAEAIQKVQGKMPVTAGLSTRGSTGVQECDTFLTKYERCAKTGMPLAARPAMLRAIVQMRDAYRKAARHPAARKTLAKGCKMAERAIKKAFKRYGCKW